VVIPDVMNKSADAAPENVENPETTNVEAVAFPKVETPALDNPVILVCPNVAIPATFNRVKSAPLENVEMPVTDKNAILALLRVEIPVICI